MSPGRRRLIDIELTLTKYGHTLQAIEYNDDSTVTAKFANGKQYTGTLLVGTDGPRSAVRKHMFGANGENTPLDVAYTNIAFGYDDAEKSLFVRKVNPVTAIMAHPDSCALLSIQDVPDPNKPEDWIFRLIMMWKDTEHDMSAETTRRQMMERADKLSEPFRSAFLWMPDNVQTRRYGLGYWIPPTENWPTHNGRATLAGDAAHSMPPHRGQGLNNAINDAFNLVAAINALANEDQTEVIQAYSDEVGERGAKEVQLSRETAAMMLDYTAFRQSALMTKGLEKA